ncbi:NirD/YgiW/YdeI family stress tolerance protein [Rahnella sp. C60]|uniref:NirD/YgiW/YdeI family stress tolerance protein n=1 Tax=Rahnella perminowiae TaxID=2816244 RepID=UPI001C2813D9|nr:NirD/YgiW/YdeI family stress tolerance protein [Rahnella perminowiae]MBU9817544.1 NirD/YgiW/YdeI family stress tolerance protein [Rahnella perminowiae]
MMKSWIIILLAAFAINTQAMADTGGGFKSDDTPPPPQKQDSGKRGTQDAHENNVANIQKTQSLNWVTIEGYLIKKTGEDTYIFRDKTGTMNVFIKKSAWEGQEITPADLVSLSGRTEKKGHEIVLNAEHLRKQ